MGQNQIPSNMPQMLVNASLVELRSPLVAVRVAHNSVTVAPTTVK